VALIIKIRFDTSAPLESINGDTLSVKKRKIIEPKRNESVTDYSVLKLPALAFVQYLQTDSRHFLDSCLR